ncbi:hypothetical protein [Cupriavidus agavae]|uniref:Uncharacterized protein n=1 Tax=Cupriavidus agavae TaxID=1001822 RepID=A0A4Q7RRY3_9BURK|nr:hypothetical protein [Cupriavidus agavae]RZT36374.1 hypothetical protein EV147_3693 [Cupriavidus agavae]
MRKHDNPPSGKSQDMTSGMADPSDGGKDATAPGHPRKTSFAAFLASIPKDESDDGSDFARIQ